MPCSADHLFSCAKNIAVNFSSHNSPFCTTESKQPTVRINCCAVRASAAEDFGVDFDSRPKFHREFKGHFGVTSHRVASLWNLIDDTVEQLDHRHVVWLLASLSFLCTHPATEIIAVRLQRDEKTCRKCMWRFTECLARLELVCAVSEINLDKGLSQCPNLCKKSLQRHH